MIKSLFVLLLIILVAGAIARYSDVVADERAEMQALAAAVADDPVSVPIASVRPSGPPPTPQAPPIIPTEQAFRNVAFDEAHDALDRLQEKLEFLERRQENPTTASERIGRVVKLTFSLDPPLDGVSPASVTSARRCYSLYSTSEGDGGRFGISAMGEMSLMGARVDQVSLTFDAEVELVKSAGDEDRGETKSRSACQGSTVVAIGHKQELLTLGDSRVMVEASIVKPQVANK